MITKEQFIEKIKTQVFPELLEIEQQYQKSKSWLMFVWCLSVFVCVIFLLPVLSFFIKLSYIDNFWDMGGAQILYCILFVLMTGTVFFEIVTNSPIKKYNKMVSPILLKLLGNCRYLKCHNIDEKLLKRSCLLPSFSDIICDDYISGKFFHTTFKMAELIFQGLKGIPVFKGLCIDIPLKKRLSGYTLLFHHHVPKNIPVLQCIKLENNLFDMNYQIYTSDQIEARTLLTPAFMERLNNLKKVLRINV